ncbi:transcriptional Coactivator p15-domain-containing protein [Mycena albidolilacea]|uniref:Transcriptional Coactivator p15-domain-containing protein n=1 Tax=Mycena albidolilacea TaxID=1033008 RepID=A0AAD6ZZL1_9AGAR|nr:transcriptional Coactivator p15-domain-containing protein [Mycena albidolilacea]
MHNCVTCDSYSIEDASVKPRSKPAKKTKVVKDEESDRDELEPESESEAPKKTVKKPTKPTKEKSEDADTECTVEVSSDGEKFINLGKNKRATVRNFKGTTLLDVREFYVDKASGETKPGKKGISGKS